MSAPQMVLAGYSAGAVVMFGWLLARYHAADPAWRARLMALFTEVDFPATRSVRLATFGLLALAWPGLAAAAIVDRRPGGDA